ncbi:MAG: nucleoside-diphosphate kinase [Candidatus Nezhaarchaeota archaeon]|nr:nucleoside-diphosphate kinase [Candidatus Nezhaarchaeota archaeon]
MESTLVLVKPDGVARGLVGEVLKRIEAKGFRIAALKMKWLTREEAEELYAVHKEKSFFNDLVAHITSAPLVAVVVVGRGAVKAVRRIVGSTDPVEAEPGTIRGDLGLSLTRNIVHASDSAESAAREIRIFFNEGEIYNYERADAGWLK